MTHAPSLLGILRTGAREKTAGVINSLSKMRELLRVRTVDGRT
jgi:hypothetical protein